MNMLDPLFRIASPTFENCTPGNLGTKRRKIKQLMIYQPRGLDIIVLLQLLCLSFSCYSVLLLCQFSLREVIISCYVALAKEATFGKLLVIFMKTIGFFSRNKGHFVRRLMYMGLPGITLNLVFIFLYRKRQ